MSDLVRRLRALFTAKTKAKILASEASLGIFSSELSIDNWNTPVDPYQEIENLRNALTLVLERETAKKAEIGRLQDKVMNLERSRTLCPRCKGPSSRYGGRALVCFECKREEEYEA